MYIRKGAPRSRCEPVCCGKFRRRLAGFHKPPISLAAERKQRERDFTAERELLIKELLEIGQSPERAAAIAQDMLYYDWLCLQATVILERWDLEPTAEATGRLVEIMAKNVHSERESSHG